MKDRNRLSLAGLFITLGIIYGDIGTSPLYVVKAIVGEAVLDRTLVLGGMSCIFWTLILITTFKYILLALKADNNGEGGIFALYGLVKHHRAKWTIFAALIGCSALIADGFITPPISISSAIEGLNVLFPDLPTLPIVVTILTFLFGFQQFGTSVIGRTFGPIMLVWFSMIGFLGARQVVGHPEILQAVNPAHAFEVLTKHPSGFWILGAVFLCTTGAEALYADLGHCGKPNIRVSWTFVLICLLLNYFGQTAWLLAHLGQPITEGSVFYMIVPSEFLPVVIIIATVATVIASQALLSGCFTLVNEAIKQRLWVNLKVRYPAESKGQLYVSSVNWMLFVGCMLVIFIFGKSSNMEAAYGLTITIDMLMTSALLLFFFHLQGWKLPYLLVLGLIFFSLELTFFVSNLKKFFYGGWFTFLVALSLFTILYLFNRARVVRDGHYKTASLSVYRQMFEELIADESVPIEASNLVFMTRKSRSDQSDHIDNRVIYSIFQKKPKRALVYWFVHIRILDAPHDSEASYEVKTVIPRKVFLVNVNTGFKVKHNIYQIFKKVVDEMHKNGEIDNRSPFPSIRKFHIPADYQYVFVKALPSSSNNLSPLNKLAMGVYLALSRIAYPPSKEFGLENRNTVTDVMPLNLHFEGDIKLRRKQ
ncbi:MAG: KUP/HAK/KT family potassium transporter [Acidobacteria bacterium]|nr:KUP/HAK/KT family potassium transporter [Acidobacteriota bacterium]